MTHVHASAYQGDFVAWPGVCGFIGAGGGGAPIKPRAHYAIQLAMALPSGLRVWSGDNGAWQTRPAALFPSRAVHSIDVNGCAMSVVLFIEPETPEGKALAARMQGRVELLDAQVLATHGQPLQRAWQVEQRYDAVQAACMALVRQLSGAARTPIATMATRRLKACTRNGLGSAPKVQSSAVCSSGGTGMGRKPLTRDPPVFPGGTRPSQVRHRAATSRHAWPNASPERRPRSAKCSIRQRTRTCSRVDGCARTCARSRCRNAVWNWPRDSAAAAASSSVVGTLG